MGWSCACLREACRLSTSCARLHDPNELEKIMDVQEDYRVWDYWYREPVIGSGGDY